MLHDIKRADVEVCWDMSRVHSKALYLRRHSRPDVRELIMRTARLLKQCTQY